MDKLAFFRRLNTGLPGITEQIIRVWGSADLDIFIDRLISSPPRSGPELTTELVAVLDGLKLLHAAEYPEYAALADSALALRLAENPNFQIVKARFPHIGSKLVATWGRLSYHQYVDSLFKNDRGGNRQGFPEEIVLAIFRLTEEHDRENPDAVPKTTDIWSVN